MRGFPDARHLRLPRLALTAAIVVGACPVFGQTASAPALKAAYLYNFARFTEWPAEALAPGDPLVLCVMNDAAVAEMLTELTKGRSVDGHVLVVSVVRTESSALSSCELLFTSGLDATRSIAVLASVAGKPVLTVSDLHRFAQLGGVAGFFIEHGTLRFAINLDAAERAGVRLSSKLLSLAKIVKEDRRVLSY